MRYKAFQKRLIQRIKPTTSQGGSIAATTMSSTAVRRSALAVVPTAGRVSGGMQPASSALRTNSMSSARPAQAGSTGSNSRKTLTKTEIYADHARSTTSITGPQEPRLPHVASASQETDDKSQCEGRWRSLAPLNERQKENRPVPQKWSEAAVNSSVSLR